MTDGAERRRSLLLVAMVFVAITGLRCAGGGAGEGAVLVSTLQLWTDPHRYDGRRVRTTGNLLGFNLGEPAEHYVIEGPRETRVELRGVDHERLETMRTRRVEVIGRFDFGEETGFGIEVESIVVVG